MEGTKDSKGAFLPAPKPEPIALKPNLTLDEILERQICILERATRQLNTLASEGFNKDHVTALSMLIKVTMELKAKEKELLDMLPDEELAKAAE